MSIKEERTKRRGGTGAGNWLYDPAKHIPVLMQIFSEGGGIAAFCAHFKMSCRTWHAWRKQFPDFLEATEIAHELAKHWWESYGQRSLNDSKFNTNAWRLQMRNRFDMTDSRLISVPGMAEAPTFRGQYNAVLAALGRAEITPDEALKLANFVGAGAKIESMTEIEKRLEALEAQHVNNGTAQ